MKNVNKPIRKLSPDIIAKGSAALAQWREDKAYAERKGGKILAAWKEEQEQKKAKKLVTSPMFAIKNFCNDCVGGVQQDITACTSLKCPLYNFRPYQKGSK